MDYPKMLYRASTVFSDQKAIEDGLMSRAIETKIVNSVEEEATATDWTEDIASFIGKRRGRPPKAETQEAEGEAA